MPQHNRECFLAGASLCAARVGAVRRGTHVIVPCTSLCHLTSKSFTGPALGLGVGESAASGGCSTAEDSPSLLAACAVLGLNTVHGTQPCLSPIAAGRRGRASVRLGRSVRAGFVVVRSYRGSKSNERHNLLTHTQTHTQNAARSPPTPNPVLMAMCRAAAALYCYWELGMGYPDPGGDHVREI